MPSFRPKPPEAADVDVESLFTFPEKLVAFVSFSELAKGWMFSSRSLFLVRRGAESKMQTGEGSPKPLHRPCVRRMRRCQGGANHWYWQRAGRIRFFGCCEADEMFVGAMWLSGSSGCTSGSGRLLGER